MMTVARDNGGQWLTVTSMVNGVPTEYSVRRDSLEICPAVRAWTPVYPLGIFLDSSGYPFDPDKATRDRHVDGHCQVGLLNDQATAAAMEACRAELEAAMQDVDRSTSWNDLIYIVRSRTEERRTDRVEAEQTLLTAQTEIAKLKAALKDEALAHATTRKMLCESAADYNKQVVKVAELEKKLGELDLSKRDGYHDKIRDALGAVGRETILEAAERAASRLRVYNNWESVINEALGVQGSETALGAARRLHGKVADLDQKLRDIASDPFKYLNGRGFRLGDASVVIKATAEMPKPAQSVDLDPAQAPSGTAGRAGFSMRLDSDDRDSIAARGLLGAKPGEMAKAVDALKAKLAQSENALTHVNARCYRLEETIDKARKIAGTEWGLTLEAAVTSVVLDREAERLKKDTAIATIRTVGLILEAKDGESLNQAATRVRLELSEQSNRRTAAEGRIAEIKRALGNEGLLA